MQASYNSWLSLFTVCISLDIIFNYVRDSVSHLQYVWIDSVTGYQKQVKRIEPRWLCFTEHSLHYERSSSRTAGNAPAPHSTTHSSSYGMEHQCWQLATPPPLGEDCYKTKGGGCCDLLYTGTLTPIFFPLWADFAHF